MDPDKESRDHKSPDVFPESGAAERHPEEGARREHGSRDDVAEMERPSEGEVIKGLIGMQVGM